jgi:hypothetical protein
MKPSNSDIFGNLRGRKLARRFIQPQAEATEAETFDD